MADLANPQEFHKRWSQQDKQIARHMSQISLLLDDYGDIFSDFDPRPISQKALSDDFLSEAKKAGKESATGSVELKLLIPDEKRDHRQEKIIKKRLRRHFNKHRHQLHMEKKKIIKEGAKLAGFGIVIMFLTAFIHFKFPISDSLLLSFFIIILEPAGWFLFWEGMNLVIFRSRAQNPDFEFYDKMSKCNIGFMSY